MIGAGEMNRTPDFDDRLAIRDIYKHDHSMTIEYGIRAVKMDPVICAQVMGMATQILGIGDSYFTTYYEPFHVARVFATLDMMLGGRSAWNISTSLNDSEAVPHRSLVHVHCAGAALRDPAAELGAGHAQVVAQHPQQWGRGIDVNRLSLAVDGELVVMDLPGDAKGRRSRSMEEQQHKCLLKNKQVF